MSVSSYFWLYSSGIGTKFKFLVKSLYTLKEKECFNKFKIFSNGSSLYSSMLLIFRCIPIEFAFFVL